MIINDLSEFILNINHQRLLALDVSKKRIGVAVSNHNLTLALPVTTIIRRKFLQDIKTIQSFYKDYNCGGLVIGYPLLLDYTEGTRCQSIKSFANLLLTYFEVPIFFENEQFSTFAAKDFYEENQLKQRKQLDSSAASYFLQSLLDKIKNIH